MTRVTFDLPDGDPPAEERALLLGHAGSVLRGLGHSFLAAIMARVADQFVEPTAAPVALMPVLHIDEDGDIWAEHDGAVWILDYNRDAATKWDSRPEHRSLADVADKFGGRALPWPGATS